MDATQMKRNIARILILMVDVGYTAWGAGAAPFGATGRPVRAIG